MKYLLSILCLFGLSCDSDEVGCTKENYVNFNPEAKIDDGSCYDCDGIAFGDSINDVCGVCDGDGSSCWYVYL